MTFNHASGACWMISISVENNSNKCQMQDPTQSPGRGAHSHIGPRNQHKSSPAAQYVNSTITRLKSTLTFAQCLCIDVIGGLIHVDQITKFISVCSQPWPSFTDCTNLVLTKAMRRGITLLKKAICKSKILPVLKQSRELRMLYVDSFIRIHRRPFYIDTFICSLA